MSDSIDQLLKDIANGVWIGGDIQRLAAHVVELTAQLLDAKRNEERAVAEVGELQSQLDTWTEVTCHSSVDGLRSEMHRNQLLLEDVSGQLRVSDSKATELHAERRRENRLKLDALHSSNRMQTQLDRTREDLHTLEAAVRAVRESVTGGGYDADTKDSLAELYALVPDGSESGES